MAGSRTRSSEPQTRDSEVAQRYRVYVCEWFGEFVVNRWNGQNTAPKADLNLQRRDLIRNKQL